ncbi:TBC domain-containing protein [Sphaceloma murrayae]|uniref:TBC domain-containing protein n=1 Tax=Sphaceloma murrayae TaxID=2082308 RepID=A0A2K1R056_9PEZI|nr:TBC domain-containing protein [Sphaceloma murrayae]
MTGLAILPPPVHLSLSDHPTAASSHHQHTTRRRRTARPSFCITIPEGDHHVPVHSLTTRKLRSAGSGPTVFDNKHSFQPPAVKAIPDTSSEDDNDGDDHDRSITHGCTSLRNTLAGPVPRVHSLKKNMALHSAHNYQLDMQAPDSPPDLSSSKSSKSSSSFRSSILSDTLSAENITHFEDISLDEKRDSYDFHHTHKDARSRPPTRPLHSMMGSRRKLSHTVENVRSVHIAQNRPGPLARPLDEKSTNIPVRHMRPGFRTSSGPHSQRSPHTSGDSRSPSPTNGLIHRGLQRSGASIPGSPSHNFLSVHQGMNRRKTWAPGRKTVKQLEDEYHDSDEDVPEDAVIWNVPISPLEPFTAASRDPSPRRMSSQSSLSSSGGGGGGVAYKYPSAPNTAVMPPQPSPHLGLPRSATTGSFPHEPMTDLYSLRARHKSWTNELSSEARQISAALEAHNYRSSSSDSKVNTPSGSPPASAISRRQSTSTTTLSLPPIQKSNVMIDPLPISKEKEAVLARTRPSWLPPKNKKEERKHLKEWERMMAHSAIADRRRATKQLEALETSRQTKDNVERIWEDHVLPHWDSVIGEPRTRELWWRGVNPKIRGQVWKRAIGNSLHLTSASFTKALERSSSLSEEVVSSITANAANAFRETGLFTESSPLHASLVDLLKAYAAYRPETGYQVCMTRPAALLLLNMSAPDAFIALANLLNRSLPNAFLTNDRAGIDKWTGLVWSTMKYKLPKLHDHLVEKIASAEVAAGTTDEEPSRHDSVASPAFESILSPPLERVTSAGSRPTSRSGRPTVVGTAGKVRGEDLVRPMLENMFTGHLELEAVCRVWDVWVFEGDKVLVRALVGILGMLEIGLYGTKEEVKTVLGERGEEGKQALQLGTVEEVIKGVREGGKVERR